jgi:hypothetical protein
MESRGGAGQHTEDGDDDQEDGGDHFVFVMRWHETRKWFT